MQRERFCEGLARGLQRLDLPADAQVIERLADYAGMVLSWSRSYNLVAAGDLDALLDRHFLDSLCIHPFIRPPTLLDVGSGAGFPGLPLALARPDLQVTLLDSSGKKVRFLRHVIRTLGLANVQTVEARVESFRPADGFATITSRAFASLREFMDRIRHLLAPGTRVLALKGRKPDRELSELPAWVQVEAVERIIVPDLHAERHLVMMSLSRPENPQD